MDPFADLDGLLNGSASDGSDSSEASELDLGELLGGDISVLDEGAADGARKLKESWDKPQQEAPPADEAEAPELFSAFLNFDDHPNFLGAL
eukprot:COSAG04_NODE_1117_length_8197_cov_19.090258_11_plen_91_part_00